MTHTTKQRGRTVAITGAASGLGRELALGFSAKDYRVFGTTRSAEEIAELLGWSIGAKLESFKWRDRWILHISLVCKVASPISLRSGFVILSVPISIQQTPISFIIKLVSYQ